MSDPMDKSAVWRRSEIESPCVQICVIHPAERICTGCYRTIDEIRDWSRMTAEQRRQIMSELKDRAASLTKRRGGRSGRRR